MIPVVRGVIRSNGIGIDVVGAGIDVGEDRRDPLPLEGMGRGDERERRHDDLARHPAREWRSPGRPWRCTSRRSPNAESLCDPMLKLLHERTIVREALICEDPSDMP